MKPLPIQPNRLKTCPLGDFDMLDTNEGKRPLLKKKIRSPGNFFSRVPGVKYVQFLTRNLNLRSKNLQKPQENQHLNIFKIFRLPLLRPINPLEGLPLKGGNVLCLCRDCRGRPL